MAPQALLKQLIRVTCFKPEIKKKLENNIPFQKHTFFQAIAIQTFPKTYQKNLKWDNVSQVQDEILTDLFHDFNTESQKKRWIFNFKKLSGEVYK